MQTKKKEARIAGLWYLLMGITGGFGIMYIPMSVLVTGDATATANNIMNSEWLYRLSMLSNLIGQIAFIFLVLALNRLFDGVNTKLSKLMLALIMVGVPIAMLNTLNMVGAMSVLSGATYWNVFEQEQLNAVALGFLEQYNYGLLIAQIFWGLWLLPLGLLSIQSKLIPKAIGILLIIGCFSYLIIVVVGFLSPQFNGIVSSILMIPLAMGEFSIIGWLLIKGVKESVR